MFILGAMIAGRAPQGTGMAAFPLSSVIAVGGCFGAVLDGPVVSILGRRWLFWLPAVVLVIAVLLVRKSLPESPSRAGGRVNLVAATLLSGLLVALLLPLSQGTQWGWTSPAVIDLLIAAAVLMTFWVVVEARSDNPLIDMRLMRQPAIWTANLVAPLLSSTMFAFGR